MSAGALALALLPLALGGLLGGCLWPRCARLRAARLLRVSLAVGLGLGLSSCVFFLWLAAGGARRPASLAPAELWLAAAAGALFLALRGWREDAPGARCPPQPPSPVPDGLLRAALALLAALAAVSFGLRSLWRPDGGWDATMIWNQRARFLYRGGEHWSDAFAAPLAWSHPDYPLALPGSIARAWALLGLETPWAPIALHALFALVTLGALLGALRLLRRDRQQALLGGIFLLGTAFFVRQAFLQHADVSLGFFFLATLVALVLGDAFPSGRGRFAALAGVSAALAAWTKNEGLLWLLAAALAAGAPYARRSRRASARALLCFGLGAAPVACALAAFKLGWAPASDLTLALEPSDLLDPRRYGLVLRGLLLESLLLPVPLLLGYGALLGLRSDWRRQRGALRGLGLLAFVLAGYAAVYLLTPLDLVWHLQHSARRLLLQLWPGGLLLSLVLLKTPREALAEGEPAPGGAAPGEPPAGGSSGASPV